MSRLYKVCTLHLLDLLQPKLMLSDTEMEGGDAKLSENCRPMTFYICPATQKCNTHSETPLKSYLPLRGAFSSEIPIFIPHACVLRALFLAFLNKLSLYEVPGLL